MPVKEHIASFMHEGEQYLDAKSKRLKLEVVEETINTSASILSWFVVFCMGMLSVVLLGIIGVLSLAQLLDSYIIACLIVSGFFLLIFLFLFFYNKNLLYKPIKNYLLGMYLSSIKNETNG